MRRLGVLLASVIVAVSVGAPALSNDREYAGGGVVVEQAGTAPQLCVGPMPAIRPPTCVGIPVANLDWDRTPGVERDGGVTWATVRVRGTYDGTTLTLTRDPQPFPPPRALPFGFPPEPALCSTPDTVDPAADRGAWVAAVAGGDPIADAQTLWVTRPADSPSGTFLVNVVALPGAKDAVVQRMREGWRGSLCVDERVTSNEAAGDVASRLPAVIGAETFGATSGRSTMVVAFVAVDGPRAQRAADREFGPGVVDLVPALIPVG